MPFSFSVSTPSGPMNFQMEAGTSILIVGANGGGKTRLAVQIERALGDKAHRISAHRALVLNPSVPKISERAALSGLRTGYAADGAGVQHRGSSRWQNRAEVFLLNDYDYLVQSLFADQANTSLTTHKNVRAGIKQPPSLTKFETLVEIWDRILPHRKLDISGDDIRAFVAGSSEKYSSSDMSDGERAIFYLIGQTLAAARDSVIIFDEPELHIHRSIMSRL
jgi:energy-coupling factor transporter ATP-binding protein EcfA2